MRGRGRGEVIYGATVVEMEVYSGVYALRAEETRGPSVSERAVEKEGALGQDL